MKYSKSVLGFTLLEMILVLAIMSTVLLMIAGYTTQRFEQFRRDKAALQMQQVLNAGLAYYMATGSWPAALADLQPDYLPATFTPPWPGSTYTVSSPTPPTYFRVSVTVGGGGSAESKAATAAMLAGMLPAGDASNAPTVTAQVTIPGENANNARAINFANLYHQGACVPVPNCPAGMTAQIFVVPVSVSGMNDTNSTAVYPITSFSAYATGPSSDRTNVPRCNSQDPVNISPNYNCYSDATLGTLVPVGSYWRVCQQVVTQKGDVASTSQGDWGEYANILAVTRCAPSTEPTGSSMGVYTN